MREEEEEEDEEEEEEREEICGGDALNVFDGSDEMEE